MSGRLAKAEYLARLLDENGGLSHWGLEREHGVEAAREAMDGAYSSQIQEMLRVSLRELWYETEKAGGKSQRKDLLLSSLRDAIESRGGKKLNQVQLSHLKSVLNALLELALHERTDPGS